MVDTAGVVVLAVFYILILVVGILAAKCFKPKNVSETERSLVAGRQLNLGVGIVSLTATCVGGGFLSGFAESVALYGVIWMLMPIGMMLGYFISAYFYGGVMRKRKYLTMLDPFYDRYGGIATAILFLVTLLADVLWTASILTALGSSLSVIIEVDFVVSVVVSAAVAVCYTMFGQMISVSYTDVLQLAFITIGLGIAIPFAATNDNVDLSSLSETPARWLGTIEPIQIGSYIDLVIAVWIFGSLPWQVNIQRFLSMKSVRDAKIMGVIGGIAVAIIGVAPVAIGVIGIATDWNSTSYGVDPIKANMSSMVLPVVLYHLTPRPVAVIALCAVTAAVMSSIDSGILGSSAMFTQNVYSVIRKKASSREQMVIRQVTTVILGAISSLISIYGGNTVIGLYYLSADIAVVLLIPTLTCSMYIEVANGYGALFGSGLGLVLILGKGIPSLNLHAFISYPPYHDKESVFPIRILCTIVATLTIVIISYLTNIMFLKGFMSRKYDILNQFSTASTDDMEREVESNRNSVGYGEDHNTTSYSYENPLEVNDNTKL
ncbi:unnamed protein product [Owenia fusiformis]|uniref:High-affinity choline transporter 1 n=1 Tax=Owenia fusiformis TaxID=6347 RepID=A0A8S4PU23_OWEFU|nr:unnamed protein product [Owenia fusiformis]